MVSGRWEELRLKAKKNSGPKTGKGVAPGKGTLTKNRLGSKTRRPRGLSATKSQSALGRAAMQRRRAGYNRQMGKRSLQARRSGR